MSSIPQALPRAQYPFADAFYADLVSARDSFRLLSSHVVPRGTGYGFRVGAGQAFRLVTIEAAQIVDLCLMNADDPTERYSTGAQVAIEGSIVTRLTRVWGTPPLSRPLATCTADTVRWRPNASCARDHFAHSAHCNAHQWYLYTGSHHRPCYDNLRAGMAMVDLSQRSIHDNLNIFMKCALEPATAIHQFEASDAEAGDYIEFYAEIPLHVVLSLCPTGSGATGAEGFWEDGGLSTPVYPLGVEVYETGVEPLPWPYRATDGVRSMAGVS